MACEIPSSKKTLAEASGQVADNNGRIENLLANFLKQRFCHDVGVTTFDPNAVFVLYVSLNVKLEIV
jgi:hypothetical protein